MKKAIIIPLVVLVSCLSAFQILVSATVVTKDGISVSISDVFTVFTEDNLDSNSSKLEAIGETKSGMETKFKQDGYLFYAVSEKMNSTVFLRCEENKVSEAVVDLINYSDKETAKRLLIGSGIDKASEVKEIERNGALFYRLMFTPESNPELSDSRIMYITVINGRSYTLCLIEKADTLSSNSSSACTSIFESMDYTVESEACRIQERKDRVISVAFSIAIPVAVIIAGIIIWSLIRDFRAKHLEEDRRRNSRRKPRR